MDDAIEFDRSDRTSDNKAEIKSSAPRRCVGPLARRPGRTTWHCSAEFRVDLRVDPVLSLVVWTLKREVRAIRGCLGMYRR